ncbi:hypothetical protein ACFE04_027321 [Oxalis oulophora]
MMNLRKLIGKQTDGALTLARHVLSSKEAVNKNAVCSPLIINMALSLIANGYKKGPTQNQILSFLGSKSIHNLNSVSSNILSKVFADRTAASGPTLSLANGVWFNDHLTLKDSFKQLAHKVYEADLKSVDFANKSSEVVREINEWAAEKTNGLITHVLKKKMVNSLTTRIFTNAIYFKGVWQDKFKKSNTKKYNFHLQDGSKVKVPFMCGGETRYIQTFDDFKVAKLAYENGNDCKYEFSMYIFLPNANDGLPALVEKLTSSGSTFINEHLSKCRAVQVGDYRIPKFKFEFEFDAKAMIEKMGLDLPFANCGETPTEMTEVPLIEVSSSIIQKALIEVNEEGTEAAAFNICLFHGCALSGPNKPKPVDFVADHPFMFMIREDETSSILFVGQVLNPLEK